MAWPAIDWGALPAGCRQASAGLGRTEGRLRTRTCKAECGSGVGWIESLA